MSEAFGIMDTAYFVNKNDILKWINTTLKVRNVARIRVDTYSSLLYVKECKICICAFTINTYVSPFANWHHLKQL